MLPGAGLLLLGGAMALGHEPRQASVRVEHVAGKVSVLFGRGGNIGLSVGDDGILMVDDQFLELADEIDEAVDKLSLAEQAYVVNTHWHGDHTGGNPHFGRVATIVAHENVRRRLARDPSIEGQVADQETATAALPVITYEEGLSLFFNGERVRLLHVPRAHTDGDTVVWFEGSNVVHLGDLFFQSGYPFIDVDSGGSIAGLIAGIHAILDWIPDDVRIVPGHGAVSDVDGLREYLAMLEVVTERVRELLAEGVSLQDMIAGGVTEDFDARWGGAFIAPERIVELIAASLKQ